MGASKKAIDAQGISNSVEIARQGFDWTEVSPTTAIAETLATVEGSEPAEIGPLYESINSDALDALVRNQEADCAVVFPYEEYSVTVTASGEVTVYVSEDHPSE